jgi:hypothetical protein
MTQTLIGVDSKLCVLKHKKKTWKSCLGPVIKFEGDYSDFKQLYNEALDDAFENFEKERRKQTYKSYDLMKQFAEQKEESINFLSEFFDNILGNEKLTVEIVYTKFSKDALDGGRVNYYSSVESTERSEELNDFIDDLVDYFPVISAFKSLDDDENHKIYLDNFSGEVTKSWDSLINAHDVSVLVNGDKVNKLVSLSDLISKYLNMYLNRFGNAYLSEETIKDSFGSKEKINTIVVHNQDLDYIVPHRPDEISTHRYYPDPMFFILLDNEFGNEKSWFESSEYYDLACLAAETRNSSVKFLDLDSDFDLVSSEDFLVYVGDQSKKDAEQISNFNKGKPLPIDNISDMI